MTQIRFVAILLTVVLLTVVALSACKTAAPESVAKKTVSSVTVVRAEARPVEISAGGTSEAVVTLTIDDGFHVNANPPTFPYLKATELVIAPSNGISGGKVTYPSPLQKKFEFAEEALAVYEGRVELKTPLKAEASASKGQHSVPAKVNIQACDQTVCYPPGTIDLSIPVVIK